MTDHTNDAKLDALNAMLLNAPADLTWNTPEASTNGTGDCLETARVEGGYLVRNSNMPGTVLPFTDSEWAAFAQAVRNGQPGFAPGA
ncbi:DUF397 domain-containing protein [Streptomyces anulatus]|uniref:DUF397 domain-containing protein n=1 Tax=Streptomyces anulatus TaxID=1892 RepID=UPI003691DC00